ncbi:MAG: PQQ-like beta-propeller repeat protein [Verrucomicrobiales bacterium]|nr:PQQ-like beta-propeller repeat protein [Verrucomicrobiales bacterium]
MIAARSHTRRALLALTLFPTLSALADWPQWRGPTRGGVSTDTTPIADHFASDDPQPLWTSDFIPSDHYGGHGSPIVAGERVFLSVVWHDRVPSEQREIDTEVMQQVNYRGTSPELTTKLEEARLNLSPRLRGAKLDAWIDEWVKTNMSEKDQLALGSWAASRFRAGATAFPLDELAKVAKRQDKPFANADALRAWMAEENLSEKLQEKLLSAIPNTIKVAKDTLVCLDLATGKELWKFEAEGKPTGRKSSSTAAVIDGRVYAVGSTHLYAVNAETGELLWKTPLPGNGPAASPLVVDDTVYVAAGVAMAFDAATGTQRWKQDSARGDTASPQWWQPESGDPVLLFTGSKDIYGLQPSTGKVLWQMPGGGQSTPVTSADWMVLYSSSGELGLAACRHQPDKAPEVAWSDFWVARRYSGSPIIHDGCVYLTCGNKHQCLDLATGTLHWSETVNSTITSPILADGKLLVFENNGSHLRIIQADPAGYQQIARLKVSGMGCTSPALSNGRLIVRQKEALACFDLRPQP